MADATGTIVTFTVDRLAYSPSPPVVFAVVDFDGGGRLPVELTDVDPDEVAIGGRVEMTFRRLFTADGIHNYFWKARLVRDAAGARRRTDMGSHGIKDRVAIVGMGCTRFAEHWDKGADDLLIDAADEAFKSAGVEQGRRRRVLARHRAVGDERHDARQAAAARGQAGHPRRELLRHRLRGAAPGRVRGRVRRLRHRHGGRRREGEGLRLPGPQRVPDPERRHGPHAHRGGDVLDGRARLRQEVRRRRRRAEDGARAIASKNHYNGARNPRAQFRREMSVEQICAMPPVAGQLSVFDCAGVADGAAAAIVVRAEDAHRYTDKPLYVKALSFVAGNGSGLTDPTYDYTTFPEIVACAQDAYAQAGITDPRRELAMAEVHDCFTPTELVLMEDLGFCERGTAWKEVLAGAFDLDGDLPVNPDGGLKSFGHPVGASGLRMMFEAGSSCAARRPRSADRHDRRPQPRAHPQPRRLPGRDGVVRLDPRHRRRTEETMGGGHLSRRELLRRGAHRRVRALERGRVPRRMR